MQKSVGYVTVLGKKYSVYSTNNTLSGNSVVGATNRDMQTITISDDAGAEQKNDTMLHEILHIISFELKLNIDEDNIARLACGLHSAGIIAPKVRSK